MRLLEFTDECRAAAKNHWPGIKDGAAKGERHKRQTRTTIRVFKNGVIEHFFAKAHPITPIVWFGPPMIFGLYRGARAGGVLAALGMFVLGWLVWSLIEYVLHRFLFHMSFDDKQKRESYFMLHGYHHEFPRDGMRLVAPPFMSWPPGILIFGLTWLALGPSYGPALFAGIAAGYVAYDWIHYYTHHFHPTTRLGQWLVRYHQMHHFDEEHVDTRFGVSSPLWDFVFNTYRPVRLPKKHAVSEVQTSRQTL